MRGGCGYFAGTLRVPCGLVFGDSGGLARSGQKACGEVAGTLRVPCGHIADWDGDTEKKPQGGAGTLRGLGGMVADTWAARAGKGCGDVAGTLRDRCGHMLGIMRIPPADRKRVKKQMPFDFLLSQECPSWFFAPQHGLLGSAQFHFVSPLDCILLPTLAELLM